MLTTNHYYQEGTMLKSITINVEGMSCSHCEMTVQKAAESINGVSSAKANAKKGVVKFKTDNPDSAEAVKSAIREAGFKC